MVDGAERQFRDPRHPSSKIMSWENAAAWRNACAGKVVFTNGVFDLLHPGHIAILDAARREGDALIVGLNTDDSVKRLKGPSRPVRTAMERAIVLAGLEAVDLVVEFEQDTPHELVALLQPDVIVKGGDYNASGIAGADIVVGRGGRVVIVPLVEGQSTTSIIEVLRGQNS